ncbi:cytochrome P450 2J2-like [Rhincodon typus]|uniref:cytochrome P450 2J2-like n=1 Tax=Rhincodon typus TaxID=259920 RepID=UPI0009A3A998|nr:cytochrome P450 2J2-like [Rhincodon typus]XP_048473539.1 cytochrome P450 2J2-like [Rhincodon typus]XP_048473540.1 cytochrome P450 2J2-like [Rhincodon typus]XP_048473541.1 cytochrome P450 2J2-like [Rhincodon typus]XP_048473542.1 cytochrome P450 2J2-like [Rhincodon typus]
MESAEAFRSMFWLNLQAFLIFLAVFFLVTVVIRRRRTSNLPPGPSAFSLVGNIFYPDQSARHELSRKYGNIFTTHILWIPIIILNGFQTIQEALTQHGTEFAGRPYMHITDLLSKGQGIITAPYGRSWKQQRWVTLTVLRNFGLGQFAFEDKILEEAHYLAAAFRESEGSSFDPQAIITSAVSNVICKVTFGKRFHYEDRTFKRLVALFDEALKLQAGFWAMVCCAIPNMNRFPGPHQRIFKNKAEIEAILQDFIQQHKDSLDGEEIRDFIDAYLLEMEKERNFPGSCLLDGNLLYNTYDLFLAGTETTTTTLRWAFLYMMAYPDIQEKCQKEIDQVIGSSRAPSLSNRPDMPYVNAVIHEIQRFGNILPFAVSHATTQDTEFMGYTLKKGTVVLINLSSVLLEESQWKHPNQFNPENFLNEKGEFFKPDAFIPFSMGLRACLGEKLAKMELFLFFTSLLQKFEFHWPDKTTPPDLKGLFKIVMTPRPYKLQLRSRKVQNDDP